MWWRSMTTPRKPYALRLGEKIQPTITKFSAVPIHWLRDAALRLQFAASFGLSGTMTECLYRLSAHSGCDATTIRKFAWPF